MGCIYFTETFIVAIMHQLAFNFMYSLNKVTAMETDIPFTSLCLGFVMLNNHIHCLPGCKESSPFSIDPFPINATLFHVKAKINRWIPAGEKSSYLTGRLCTWSLEKYNTVLPVLTDNLERNRYMNHEWCAGD